MGSDRVVTIRQVNRNGRTAANQYWCGHGIQVDLADGRADSFAIRPTNASKIDRCKAMLQHRQEENDDRSRARFGDGARWKRPPTPSSSLNAH